MSQVKQIEVTIEEVRERIAVMDALIRLNENPDFLKVVNEGYLKDEAVRLAHMVGDYTVLDQEKVKHDLHSIGALHRYFRKVLREGHMAESALRQHEDELVHAMRAEAGVVDEEITDEGDYNGNLGA